LVESVRSELQTVKDREDLLQETAKPYSDLISGSHTT